MFKCNVRYKWEYNPGVYDFCAVPCGNYEGQGHNFVFLKRENVNVSIYEFVLNNKYNMIS